MAIEVTDVQAELHNRLIELCKMLTMEESERNVETIARIQSIVHGKHITDKGLYWQGLNMSP